MSWPSLILPSRARQPADIVETTVDVAAVFDGRTFEAEVAIDQRVSTEIVDRRRTQGAKELAALHTLEHRNTGAVAQLNPGNAARPVEPCDALSDNLTNGGVARGLLIDCVNHSGVVLITQAFVWEQLTRHDKQSLRRMGVNCGGGQCPGVVRGEDDCAARRQSHGDEASAAQEAPAARRTRLHWSPPMVMPAYY